MSKTKIEWATDTWNPLRGTKGKWHCTKVSDGCANCYAESMNIRFSNLRYRKGADIMRLDNKVLMQPLSWRKPRVVFVCSMTDIFHEDVGIFMLADLFSIMANAKSRKHLFLVLTKRAERMKNYINEVSDVSGYDPPPNIWFGVSVENQKAADERIPHLVETRGAKRFLSAEPLLGPVELQSLEGIDWVIAGGESGTRARPCQLNWLRTLRDQCLSSRTAYFLKQLGGRKDKRGEDAAILDGKLWREMPELPSPANRIEVKA